MKALRLISFLLLLSVCMIAEGKKKAKCPTPEEFKPIADSIVREGYRLYVYEKMAWVGSDSMYAHCSHAKDVNAQAYLEDAENRYYIFGNIDKAKIYFVSTFSKSTNLIYAPCKSTWNDMDRAAGQYEMDVLNYRNTSIRKAFEACRDSIYKADGEEGGMNFDVLYIDSNLTRVYMLQGTSKSGVLPIGNDYMVELDKNYKVLDFKRFHHSYIPMKMQKGLVAFMHSHTPDNPYMTATDVCNALLYARDLFRTKEFYVSGSAFQSPFTMKFNMINCELTAINDSKTSTEKK